MTDEPDAHAAILARIKAEIERGVAALAPKLVAPNHLATQDSTESSTDPSGGRSSPLTPVPASRSTTAPARSTRHHLAQLAHELKTPLSAIVAAAEIMRDERLGPVGNPLYRGYAADIHESASHALGVITAMLTPSTHELLTSRDAPTFIELDLNELARRSASSVRALLAAAGLEIDHALVPNLPHVIADPVTVRQMLLNLVTNAMRATPAGGRIVIETTHTLNGPVCLHVTDTGLGLSTEEIAALLDPARVPASPSVPSTGPNGVQHGLGFGYPLILQLATINAATLAIASHQPGCHASDLNPAPPPSGTRVTVSFPPDRVIPV